MRLGILALQLAPEVPCTPSPSQEVISLRDKTIKGCRACNVCSRNKDKRCNTRDDEDSDALGTQAIAYAKLGNKTTALQLIQHARQIKGDDTLLMFREATIFSLAGNTAGAVSSLRQALQHNYSLEEINSDPELANLRRTPEFAQLLQEFTKKAPK